MCAARGGGTRVPRIEISRGRYRSSSRCPHQHSVHHPDPSRGLEIRAAPVSSIRTDSRARLLRPRRRRAACVRRREDASSVRVCAACVWPRVYAREHETFVTAVVPRGGVKPPSMCRASSWLRQSRATTGTAATGTGAASLALTDDEREPAARRNHR